MSEKLDFTFEAIEARVDDIIQKAYEVISERLEPSKALIKEVKTAMAKGVDQIPTNTLMEWSVAIPILIDDFVPQKEAFGLMKDLWDIETKQMGAKNLLELDMKKSKIESINRVTGTENEKKRLISRYMQNVLAGVQEALWILFQSIRKILDSRIASGGL